MVARRQDRVESLALRRRGTRHDEITSVLPLTFTARCDQQRFIVSEVLSDADANLYLVWCRSPIDGTGPDLEALPRRAWRNVGRSAFSTVW